MQPYPSTGTAHGGALVWCAFYGAKRVQARTFAKAAKLEPVLLLRIRLFPNKICDADHYSPMRSSLR